MSQEYLTECEWVDAFVKQYLGNDGKPSDAVAKLTFDVAWTEHRICDESHRSLTSKAHELLKLLAAVIGGYVVLMRSTASAGQLTSEQKDLEFYQAFSTCASLLFFMLAMGVTVLCVRGLPFMNPIGAKAILCWYDDETSASHYQLRSAAYLQRCLVANRHVNEWMSRRLSIAWTLTISGLLVMTVSLGIKLFSLSV